MTSKLREYGVAWALHVIAIGVTSAAAEVSLAQNSMSLTLTSDSIVDSNALLVASSGNWGRAINGEAYRADALLTYDGYQYTAWYRNDSDKSIMITRRSVDGSAVGAWETVDTGSNLVRGLTTSNVHNVISLGVAPADGTIHMAYDMHAQEIRYRVTQPGVATTNKNAWGPGMFDGGERNELGTRDLGNITYPTFVTTPSGDLQFMYRGGQSGNGKQNLTTYSSATGTWSAPHIVTGSLGDDANPGRRNAYVNGLDYDPDGKLHMVWVWREQLGGGANQHINYAYSTDGGAVWRNGAGDVVGDFSGNKKNELLISDPGILVRDLDLNQSLYNQSGQTVDQSGGVHALMIHRRIDEPGYAWESGDRVMEPEDSAYFHYYREPTSGEWSWRRLPVEVELNGVTQPLPLGRRGHIATDAAGNVFAVYTSRELTEDPDGLYVPGKLVIAGATAASGYSDWSILHFEDVLFEGEPHIDTNRLLTDGILSILIQEASDITTFTGTNLHVLEFSVSAPEPSTAAVILPLTLALLARRR